MKPTDIKFPNNIQSDFVNELRRQVRNYFEENHISKYGNPRMFVKTVFMFLLFFVPYFLMLTHVIINPSLMLVMWIIMGFGVSGIGLSVMHDANHRSYSKNQNVNRGLSLSLNFVGGFSPTWQYQHNTLHHGYTNIDGFDEDIDPGKILRLSPDKPYYKIYRFQQFYAWFFYGLMTLTWTIDKDFRQLFRYKREGVELSQKRSFGRLLTELIVSKVLYYTYMLVIPIIFLPIPWWMVVIFYFIMHLVSGFMLTIIFQTAHVMPSSEYPNPDKGGSMENNWAIHQLLTTTDYARGNRLFSWYVGGLNFQIEHHLFPNICHVHYHKISKIVEATAKKYNIPYHVQPGFLSALREHFKMLRILGRPVQLQQA